MSLQIFPLGDTGVQIVFGTVISEEINQEIRRFAEHLTRYPIQGITEWVPAYSTLTIFYQPDVISYSGLCGQLQSIYDKVHHAVEQSASLIYEIPTLYGGALGPDLAHVAEYNGLREEEVIAIHSSEDYLIYMMGFVPGFPYVGGMSKEIATPRRKNPRPRIEAGSVGIAGEQTGIYPLETPGGWQIIGRTPVKLYDPTNNDPILLSSGHYLRFVPINEQEYRDIEQAVNEGQYEVRCIIK